jgi:hypothetical protein
MQNTRPAAASFGRMVTNLCITFTTRPVNYWTSFMAGSAAVDVWVATADTLVLHLMGNDAEDETYLRTVAVVPNTDVFEPEQWDVIGERVFDGQRVALASFKGIDAATGFALEHVCAPNWYTGAQDAHDSVAV